MWCPHLVAFAGRHCKCQFLLQILEEESKLFFHLQQQQLIELIRAGNFEEALLFAQEYLAYKGEENETLLEELGVLPPSWVSL
jgi:hypothetical protein